MLQSAGRCPVCYYISSQCLKFPKNLNHKMSSGKKALMKPGFLEDERFKIKISTSWRHSMFWLCIICCAENVGQCCGIYSCSSSHFNTQRKNAYQLPISGARDKDLLGLWCLLVFLGRTMHDLPFAPSPVSALNVLSLRPPWHRLVGNLKRWGIKIHHVPFAFVTKPCALVLLYHSQDIRNPRWPLAVKSLLSRDIC